MNQIRKRRSSKGSWVETADILVGKLTSQNVKESSYAPKDRLLRAILGIQEFTSKEEMVGKEGRLLLFPLQIVLIVLMSFSPPLLVHSQCNKNPVIFNFGDSNSDSGGFAAGLGHDFGPPNGRTYFHHPSGRLCDGRLIIDFLCKYL